MYYAHYLSFYLAIKPLIFLLLLAGTLGYPIGLKSAHRSVQDVRSLELQLLNMGREILSFMDDAKNDSNNSLCGNFIRPFFVFYEYEFMPFIEEHKANQFNNVTQEQVDALKGQFNLAQHTWNSCVSHSKEVSDPLQLAERVSEDNIDFFVDTLKEHGVEGEALVILEDIFYLQQDILSSGDIRCQRSIHESYTNLMERYNLKPILIISREERNSFIEERARADFNMAKTAWENCTSG